jgi:hypothetical protein
MRIQIQETTQLFDGAEVGRFTFNSPDPEQRQTVKLAEQTRPAPPRRRRLPAKMIPAPGTPGAVAWWNSRHD